MRNISSTLTAKFMLVAEHSPLIKEMSLGGSQLYYGSS